MENIERAVASQLGTLALTEYGRNISNMMYISDQARAIVFFKDSSVYTIPAQGDALDILSEIVTALREKRDAEKNRD